LNGVAAIDELLPGDGRRIESGRKVRLGIELFLLNAGTATPAGSAGSASGLLRILFIREPAPGGCGSPTRAAVSPCRCTTAPKSPCAFSELLGIEVVQSVVVIVVFGPRIRCLSGDRPVVERAKSSMKSISPAQTGAVTASKMAPIHRMRRMSYTVVAVACCPSRSSLEFPRAGAAHATHSVDRSHFTGCDGPRLGW